MPASQHETRHTDWVAFGHYGFAAYRIWMRHTAHGMFQRHEWKRDDGTVDVEEWISTLAKEFPAHYVPALQQAA